MAAVTLSNIISTVAALIAADTANWPAGTVITEDGTQRDAREEQLTTDGICCVVLPIQDGPEVDQVRQGAAADVQFTCSIEINQKQNLDTGNGGANATSADLILSVVDSVINFQTVRGEQPFMYRGWIFDESDNGALIYEINFSKQTRLT